MSDSEKVRMIIWLPGIQRKRPANVSSQWMNGKLLIIANY